MRVWAMFSPLNSEFDDMGRDENTPIWVQHIAFEVKDYDAGRQHL